MSALRLIHTHTHTPNTSGVQMRARADSVQVLFEHWALMTGQDDARLGPQRRELLERWLVVYPIETLQLAFEGAGASRWAAGENKVGRPLNGLNHILKDEDTIERWAKAGRELRVRAERDAERQAQQAQDDAAAADPAVKAAAVAQLAALARRLRGGR